MIRAESYLRDDPVGGAVTTDCSSSFGRSEQQAALQEQAPRTGRVAVVSAGEGMQHALRPGTAAGGRRAQFEDGAIPT